MISAGDDVSYDAKRLYGLLLQHPQTVKVDSETKKAPTCPPGEETLGQTQVIRQGDRVTVIDLTTRDKLVLTEKGRGYLVPKGEKKPIVTDLNGNFKRDEEDKGTEADFSRYRAIADKAFIFPKDPSTQWRCQVREPDFPITTHLRSITMFATNVNFDLNDPFTSSSSTGANAGLAFEMGNRIRTSHFIICQEEDDSCFEFDPKNPDAPKTKKGLRESLEGGLGLGIRFLERIRKIELGIRDKPKDPNLSEAIKNNHVSGRCDTKSPHTPVRNSSDLQGMFDKKSCPELDLKITSSGFKFQAAWDISSRIPFFSALAYTNDPTRFDFVIEESNPSDPIPFSMFLLDGDVEAILREFQREPSTP